MQRRITPRFQPRLEALEDRCTPSAFLHHHSRREAHHGPAAVSAPHKGHAHAVPIKVSGEGGTTRGLPVFIGGTSPYFFNGNASHLGKYTGAGTFQLLSLDPATLTGTFGTSFVFTAANGDRLAVDTGNTPGTFALTPTGDGKFVARFVGTFQPVPSLSTGRFADVTGGNITLTAVSTPFSLTPNAEGYTEGFSMTWSGGGSLSFAHGNK